MHEKSWRRWPTFIAVIVLSAAFAVAQDEEEDDGGFEPRAGSPPARRTGGASRTQEAADPLKLSILAPESVAGLTTKEQPVVYWYASRDTDAPVELAISNLADPSNPQEVLA